MLPGDSLAEKLDNLAAFGYEGIEFWGAGLTDRVKEINDAQEGRPVKASTICAGYPGCPLDADKAERDAAINGAKDLLKAAGDIGAVGLIFVPIFGGPRIPDLSPYMDAIALEKELLVRYASEMGEVAAEAGTLLLLEPLNRYETHLLNRLEQAVEIGRKTGNPAVKLMADFFHMNIEEPDIAESIREAGDYVAHVHLADSIRWLPGYGHTDFKPGFVALKEIGFEGYMALECRVPGDPAVELPKCAEYLKAQMP
jgi:sugar phosphate isomerase/epimerase